MFTFIPFVIPHYSIPLYVCDGFGCYLYYLEVLVMFIMFIFLLFSFMKK